MDRHNEFISDNKGSIFKSSPIKKSRDTVIKKNNIIFGSSTKIKPEIIEQSHSHEANAFPVLDGNNIVGFVYECKCGEITKILFDFEQESERAAG
jgi:hypothetical protein